jgi:hypothetical protein
MKDEAKANLGSACGGYLFLVRSMTRGLVAVILSSCVICIAHGGEPIKDAPSVIHLWSGRDIKVVSVTRTTLHGSDEPAVALQYITEININDTYRLYHEAQEVFDSLRRIAEREKIHAAVVVANEPASGLISISKGVGWTWKQQSSGLWSAADESDRATIPK